MSSVVRIMSQKLQLGLRKTGMIWEYMSSVLGRVHVRLRLEGLSRPCPDPAQTLLELTLQCK